MTVTWQLRQLPPSDPPHELAWQYALGVMWSYAASHGIEHLRCVSRWTALPGLKICAETPSASGNSPDAVAFLGVTPSWSSQSHTLMVLETNGRRHSRPSDGWTVQYEYYLYTRTAKLFGLVMRVGQWLHRPDIEDWGVFGVRKSFATTTMQSATYRLAIWTRREEDQEDDADR